MTTQGFERLHKPLWELRKSLASAQAVAYHRSCFGQALTGTQLAGVGRKEDVVIHHNARCHVCIPGTGFDNVVQNVSEVGFLCHFI